MAHCGYEPTAADAAVRNPFSMIKVALQGIKTKGAMAPEISMTNQRQAARVHEEQVKTYLDALPADEKNRKRQASSAA
jgi:hypothetical protein